ncbi:hypothetical protein BET10_00180 [Pseudoalteromonas amylolytica]|uniref:Uncharacterized protein n=1 Tax=Pseudoalteromonas amylolytica TaxID=1859457 RepID=A0A1S1MP18_9GAMM|nr:hypothetical protein BET10_00180 [Pseudoalteromonas amylolytica]
MSLIDINEHGTSIDKDKVCLLLYQTPDFVLEVSMYKVRKKLFEKYSKSDGVDVAYWKAFPFRVYQQI